MGTRKPISKETRIRVHEKYGGRCAYCGQPITLQEMQVDHMDPVARGGEDDEVNYMPACRTCNHYKHTLSVEAFRGQIGLLTKRLAERVYIYKLALRHGRIREADEPVRFYFEDFR